MRHIRLYTCGSTNDEARDALGRSEALPFLISTRKQTSGRGRNNRAWSQLAGNFAGTFALPVPEAILQVPGTLALLAGVAVRDALIAHNADPASISLKWPNDVLLNERKVSGVLAEWITTGNCTVALVGIGVNLAAAPTGARFPATSVFGANAPDAQRFGETLASQVERRLLEAESGADSVFNAWRAAAWRLGEPLTLTVGEERVSGIFRDIDAHGRLILRLAGGQERHLSAGDATSR
ncbi:MAG: biotin--[acetyl-CoA-carboxylase] ligase [Pseudomonadota bacterium]